MYGKIFTSMWTGSMAGVGPVRQIVWAYAFSHACPRKIDGHEAALVELSPVTIAAEIGCTPDEVREAINFLCAEDTGNSRSVHPTHGTKRLVEIGPYVYEVVNHKKYREMHDEDARREYQAAWVREKRLKNRLSTLSVDSQSTRGRQLSTVDFPSTPKKKEESKKEEEENKMSPSAPSPAAKSKNGFSAEQARDLCVRFAELAPSLPTPSPTEKRQRVMASVWKAHPFQEEWDKVFHFVEKDPWWNGSGAWKGGSIDGVLRNFDSLLERAEREEAKKA